jgi:hypothetical protein
MRSLYRATSVHEPELSRTPQPDNVSNLKLDQPYMKHMPSIMTPLHSSSFRGSELSRARLFKSSLIPVNDYHSRSWTPPSKSLELGIRSLNNQSLVPMSTFDNEIKYNCDLIEQLQGNYEIETPIGKDQVSVFVPTVTVHEVRYAIVRNLCSDGEALPDQFIYQELKQFTLSSALGKVEAVLEKGSNVRYTVEWKNVENESRIFWQRKGEVTSTLLTVNTPASSRRNSINSAGTVPITPRSFAESAINGPDDIPPRIRPELLQQGFIPNRRTATRRSAFVGGTFNDGCQLPWHNQSIQVSSVQSDHKEEAMFELIKAHCVRNPRLLKKMANWATTKSFMRLRTPEELRNLTEGRIWVAAYPAVRVPSGQMDCLQDSLDDIKGAYTQVDAEVYKQPEPQENEPGNQHRLCRGPLGCWRIEGQNTWGEWEICAQELTDERWLDMKNDGRAIKVKLIPMIKILQKMGGHLMSSNQDVEKSMDFLFTLCNQKKLNSKLKGRNLKHNITNLKVKLEKQYSLSFAVQVANIADSIAQDSMFFY